MSKYTIAICNFEMAKTLEESLKSILSQIPNNSDFEVLVIDDGSTDGSQKILDKLETNYSIFRWIEGENDNIGEARAQANEEAEGKYILTQLDMDNIYRPVIEDFIRIFEEVNSQRNGKFYLAGGGLNIGPKTLLLENNYRSLGYGEDKDLWRRLLSENAMIHLDVQNAYKSIGYDYSRLDRLKLSYESTKVNFKSGITFSSFLSWKAKNINVSDDFFKILISPYAYIKARYEGRYNQPEPYNKMGKLFKEMDNQRYTVPELEKKYDFEIKDELSEKGQEILYL